ncbi:hypothetical protein ACPPVU_05830 [Mucilaginibacter sp. McL0603]|uniref:hypothetical protein n=1 Tax=Mucilaginibacter sp. McL0603 TaxID=3415670 RepID=UPI003CF7F364
MKYQLDFNTAYNQFYIVDGTKNGDTASANFWTNDAFQDRLAIEEWVLGVGIESYGHVKAELQLLNSPTKEIDFSKYDHIVEGGIKISSGLLQIIDCPNSEIALSVLIEPGNYRVRVYSMALDGVDTDEDEGDDHYLIEIWPDQNMARTVLKRYKHKSAEN